MMKYIFCIIALLVQPVFSWYVYHKQDKKKAALKMPMLYYSVAYMIVQLYVFLNSVQNFQKDTAFILILYRLEEAGCSRKSKVRVFKDRIQYIRVNNLCCRVKHTTVSGYLIEQTGIRLHNATNR